MNSSIAPCRDKLDIFKRNSLYFGSGPNGGLCYKIRYTYIFGQQKSLKVKKNMAVVYFLSLFL